MSYLDERPSFAGSTLLGCERSQQIHRWFYGEEAARTIDWCPRRLMDEGPGGAVAGAAGLVLSRCCMLEEGLERRSETVMVPWGATLDEVRRALRLLAGSEDGKWTRT